jgi:hypothetical protein
MAAWYASIEEILTSEIMKYRWWIDGEENLDLNEIITMKTLKYYKNQKERKEEKKKRWA